MNQKKKKLILFVYCVAEEKKKFKISSKYKRQNILFLSVTLLNNMNNSFLFFSFLSKNR